MPPDFETAYRAMSTRDSRFDGQFVTAVKTTGIYCRPACPSRTPHRGNVTFFATPAAAQAAGFRACRRCIPDAAPGSPEWNARADTVGAAMRLIGDGVVDREGVTGLARRLGYSERHLTRMLTAELGAAPLSLARAKRADTARILLTRTALPAADIAFAAGFSSVRQFNDTIREVYASTPTALRARGVRPAPALGSITLRLAVRTPFDSTALLGFLGARAIPGVEAVSGRRYARTLNLPGGPGTVVLTFPADDARSGAPGSAPSSRRNSNGSAVTATLTLTDLADLAPAVDRCRRLIDADADPVGIAAVLGADPALAAAVAAAPGIRLPGAVDGPEILIRALVGQQVSVAAARTKLAALTLLADERVEPRSPAGGTSADGTSAGGTSDGGTSDGGTSDGGTSDGGTSDDGTSDGGTPDEGDAAAIAALTAGLTHLFPSPQALAALGPAAIVGPRRRAATIIDAATDMASGALVVDAGRRTAELTEELIARSGIGPWTAGYVAMRVLGDPDILLTGDLALRHGAGALGLPDDPRTLTERGRRWGPFRSYAGMYLWRNCPPTIRTRRPPAAAQASRTDLRTPSKRTIAHDSAR